MNTLPLLDLHCDTLYEALKQNKSLISNDLHLSFERLAKYNPFCQVLAVWSDKRLDGEAAWERFLSARDLLTSELTKCPSVRRIASDAELCECEKDGVGAVILAVEGGKLIGNDLSRLDVMRKSGVRFLTLTWNDPCPICSANGTVNSTNTGVTDFGYEVLSRCQTLGIIPDVSHASDAATDDVIAFAKEHSSVCVATHSNSRAVCQHSRNLTDERFIGIARLGGLVGISLAPEHLNTSGKADITDIVRHIEHYMSLGGENTVSLGCDFDGIESTPDGIGSVSELEKLAEALGRINYTDELIKKVFYENARNFISIWLK